MASLCELLDVVNFSLEYNKVTDHSQKWSCREARPKESNPSKFNNNLVEI